MKFQYGSRLCPLLALEERGRIGAATTRKHKGRAGQDGDGECGADAPALL